MTDTTDLQERLTIQIARRCQVNDYAETELIRQGVKAGIEAGEADNAKLKAALERLARNFDLLLAQKPVRDVCETKAEVRAALTGSTTPEEKM
jgi:hypothetical protein